MQVRGNAAFILLATLPLAPVWLSPKEFRVSALLYGFLPKLAIVGAAPGLIRSFLELKLRQKCKILLEAFREKYVG